MTPSLTYDELRSLKPCTDSLSRVAKLMGGAKKWDGKKISAKAARKAGATFDDIIWAASAVALKDPDVERRLRLWMADCAARVLHIYEKQTDDTRPRDTIIAARQFARGKIDDAARAAVWAAAGAAARSAAGDAAWAAAWAAARAAAGAAAWDAVWAAAWDAVWAAAWDAARAAAWDAAGDAARAAARSAAGDAEKEWQFDRMILWLSAKEPDDYPLPEKQQAKIAA